MYRSLKNGRLFYGDDAHRGDNAIDLEDQPTVLCKVAKRRRNDLTLECKCMLASVGTMLAVVTLAACVLHFVSTPSEDTAQNALRADERRSTATMTGASAATMRGTESDLAMTLWPAGLILCAAVGLFTLFHHLLFRRTVHGRIESLTKALTTAVQDPVVEVPIVDNSSDEWGVITRAVRELAANHRQAVASLNHSDDAADERRSLRDGIKAMNGLMAVVGHELRTPLAALRAMSECMILGDVDLNSDQSRGFLQAIHDETVHMANLVSNLLEAARLDSGHAKWNWGRLSLADVIHDAANVLRPLIDKSRIQFTTDCGSEEIVMNGDREAITRLLINLLSNSVKHTTSGAIEVFARRAHDARGQAVELTVRDTGAGIPSPVLSKLGYAFATNEGTVSANFARGSGLGLSICRVISSVHGGEISVISEPGKGSTFTARLRADLEAPVEQEADVVHVSGEAA